MDGLAVASSSHVLPVTNVCRHPLPFDRHDWVVERPDGTEVRYIIDYYHDDLAAKDNKVPRLHDVDSVKSISIDVRCVAEFSDGKGGGSMGLYMH